MALHIEERNILKVNVSHSQIPTIKSKKKENNFQIWHQSFNKKRDDIFDMCSDHETRIKNLTSSLIEEEKIKKSDKNYSQFVKGLGIEDINQNQKILPEKVLAKINELNKLNKNLKKKVEDISILNASYAINIGGKYLSPVNTKNGISSDPPKNDVLPAIDASKNFLSINNNYRTQLMRAFTNYNPILHLSNLKKVLEKADPQIENDLNNLLNNIDKDIKEFSDPQFYRKKYEKIKNSKIIKISKKLSSKFEDIKENNNKNIINKFPNPLERKKTLRRGIKEVEFVRDFLNCINNTIQDKKVANYINEVKNSSKINSEEHYETYFKDMKKAEEILKMIQMQRIGKQNDNDLSEAKFVISSNNDEILKYINSVKRNLLKDVDDK